MKTGTFMDIVGVHYGEIKSLFKTRLYNMDIEFDEDSLNDAFIKCAQRFGNIVTDYNTVIKYYWVAYLNTIRSNKSKIDCVSLDMELHDKEDCDNAAINIYNIVMDMISERFGEHDMMLYSLYKFHGWNKDDLIASGYNIDCMDARIKEIHKFVKTQCKNYIKSQE